MSEKLIKCPMCHETFSNDINETCGLCDGKGRVTQKVRMNYVRSCKEDKTTSVLLRETPFEHCIKCICNRGKCYFKNGIGRKFYKLCEVGIYKEDKENE